MTRRVRDETAERAAFDAALASMPSDHKRRAAALDRHLARWSAPGLRLTPLERQVLLEISVDCERHRRLWCGIACLVERTGGRRRTTQLAVARLVELGAIARCRAHGPGARPAEWWYTCVLAAQDLQPAPAGARARATRRRVKPIAGAAAAPQLGLPLEEGELAQDFARETGEHAQPVRVARASIAREARPTLYSLDSEESPEEEGHAHARSADVIVLDQHRARAGSRKWTEPREVQPAMFTPAEQRARLVTTATAFRWVDARDKSQEITFHYLQRVLPDEPLELLKRFVEQELLSAIMRAEPLTGDLYAWVRRRLLRAYHGWKRDEADTSQRQVGAAGTSEAMRRMRALVDG
jgi:hypothetical protein